MTIFLLDVTTGKVITGHLFRISMRTVCFTVDLDRDVNVRPDNGGKAMSLDRGSGTRPRFVSSAKGVPILAEMLDDLHIKATFFAEATALRETEAFEHLGGHEIGLHGLDHEDLTSMTSDNAEKTLQEASDIISDIAGKRPTGFRAPYMRMNESIYPILEKIGIRYDSSQYVDISPNVRPYKIGNITEFPVTQGTDAYGKKIAAYLWPMHEGKRDPQDYIDLAMKMNDGVFVIATHTWHMVESREYGPMSDAEIEQNILNTWDVIEQLLDEGFRFKTMDSAFRML